MFLMPKEEFIKEVEAEMAGYEEISAQLIEDWIEKFNEYLENKKLRDKKISVKGQNISIKLDDESDFFRIVDRYLAAIENEEITSYWSNWSL